MLYQAKAASELISRDGTNISVAVEMKLDSKKLLKHVLIGTSVKWWTKAVFGNDQRTGKDRTISAVPMEMVFDDRTWTVGRIVWFGKRDYHLVCIILIKFLVISTITQ